MATVEVGSGNSSWLTVLSALALLGVGLLSLNTGRMGFLMSLSESLQLTTGRGGYIQGEEASSL